MTSHYFNKFTKETIEKAIHNYWLSIQKHEYFHIVKENKKLALKLLLSTRGTELISDDMFHGYYTQINTLDYQVNALYEYKEVYVDEQEVNNVKQ